MTPRSSAPRVSDSRDTGAYGGEFNMSDAEFQRVADKVFEIAGIVLKDHKRQMVYTRLSRRLRALGGDRAAHLRPALLELRLRLALRREFKKLLRVHALRSSGQSTSLSKRPSLVKFVSVKQVAFL